MAESPLVVRVLDVDGKHPVFLARVVLRGSAILAGFTDRDGVVSFDDVPPGHYELGISKPGFKPSIPYEIDIESERQVAIDAELARVSLKTIGSVRAETRRRVSTAAITDGDATVRLNRGSLARALDSGELSGGAGFLGVDGHDPAQTSLSIDGVQVSSTAVPPELRGFNADLFGGVSVSGASSSALGGTINFTTLEPTVAAQTTFSANSSFEKGSSLRLSTRGSAGQFGYVVAHAFGGANGPLNDQTYFDGSGMAYVHRNAATQYGDLIKLRLPLLARVQN